MARNDLTAERLRELLHYDPETGKFRWVGRPRGRGAKRPDGAVGRITADGRLSIGVDGFSYLAHRLAWLHVTGEWPKDDIDHRDCNPLNNRWNNLRDVPHYINAQNKRRAHSHNRTGLLVVRKRNGKFFACIILPGKKQRIGTLRDIPEEAHADYLAMKSAFHEGYVA